MLGSSSTWEPRTRGSAAGAALLVLSRRAGAPRGLPAIGGLVSPGTSSLLCPAGVQQAPGAVAEPFGKGTFQEQCFSAHVEPFARSPSDHTAVLLPLRCPKHDSPWPSPLLTAAGHKVLRGAQSPPRGSELVCASGWHRLLSLSPLMGGSWAQMGTSVHTPLLTCLPRAKDRKYRLAV